MRFLFCCEFYHPSVGGVQEVMRQLAERMVQRGHHVTVATSRLSSRTFTELGGVHIVEFSVSGNIVNGMYGEIERYREFVKKFEADAILIKAAQQWTFDALFPIIDLLRARKIFIPCGFSGLFMPEYKKYFHEIIGILKKFDHLIFYAKKYRDIDFIREHGMMNFSIVPNGASEEEFSSSEPDGSLRRQLGIASDAFVFSTVGSFTGVKGHWEVAQAFARLENGNRKVALVLNGNHPVPFIPVKEKERNRYLIILCGSIVRYAKRTIEIFYKRGAWILVNKIVRFFYNRILAMFDHRNTIDFWINRAKRNPGKTVVLVDLPRPKVIDLFRETDLFVFASNIEYSPLVLYEAAAAGTPFLTVPVGNSEEIARWTGAGIVCFAPKDQYGFTRVDPGELARVMKEAMENPARLSKLSTTGRLRWKMYFSWNRIADYYERILTNDEKNCDIASDFDSLF